LKNSLAARAESLMTKVFISAGSPGNASQRSFRDAVINAIELSGLSPRLMEGDDWDYKNPLRGVRRVMDECRGAMVIAYTRYKFDEGLELREDGNNTLAAVEFPTAWNHIEAAMAYEKGLPLLVVAQKGLREDAMLAPDIDVKPHWYELDSSIDSLPGFRGYLKSWKEDIEKFAAAEREAKKALAASSRLTIAELLSALPWSQTLAFVLTLLGLLSAAATFGYRIGAGQWPLN